MDKPLQRREDAPKRGNGEFPSGADPHRPVTDADGKEFDLNLCGLEDIPQRSSIMATGEAELEPLTEGVAENRQPRAQGSP
ncbi:hypothetical protein HDE_04824 [Halotydeus destructor]|nr:hypothetical protein HDE_04824 [Halotydeus destructor]